MVHDGKYTEITGKYFKVGVSDLESQGRLQ